MPDKSAALLALEAEHEELLDFMYICPAGVVQTSADGSVRMINAVAAQLLMPIVRSASIENLFAALDGVCPELRSMCAGFMGERGEICDSHRIHLDNSGSGPNVLACTLIKVGDDCLMAMLQDVSREARQERERLEANTRHEAERLAREAAERAAQARSNFLATMSHEIRSPLSGLLGVLDMLRTTRLDAEQRRMVSMIHGSGSMLLAVLNDVLDFSKIEADALSIEPRPTDLHKLLDESIQPTAIAAAKKGVAARLDIAPDVPGWALADDLRVRQILGNLLSNALKFTAAGEIAVMASIAGDGAAPVLRVAVRDSGIGMEPAVVSRLFNPFTQADGSTTRNFGGTGLGLAISKKLAGLMKGDLGVVSARGAGSTFTLDLPLLPCAPERDRSTSGDVARLARPGQRVLVVDDDPTMRWLAQRQLEMLGYAVDLASDGEAGRRQFLASPYDLLLTDCHMPGMDGVALTKAIRASPRGAEPFPIIGLTADVTEAQREHCLGAGMTALVTKPVTIERLAAVIDRHLNGAAKPGLDAGGIDGRPAVRPVVFDDSIYGAIFDPAAPEGAAWLGNFLEAAHADMAALRELCRERPSDAAAVKTVAHRLAGAAFSAGATLLGEAARTLEAAAPKEDHARLDDLLATVADALNDAQLAIGAFLNAPARSGDGSEGAPKR